MCIPTKTEVCIATRPAPMVLQVRWWFRVTSAILLIGTGVATAVLLKPIGWYWWIPGAVVTGIAVFPACSGIRCYLRWKRGFIIKKIYGPDSKGLTVTSYYDIKDPDFPLGCQKSKK